MALCCMVLATGLAPRLALAQQPPRARPAEREALVPALPTGSATEAGARGAQGSTPGPLGPLQSLVQTVSLDFVDTPVTDVLRCLELEATVAFRVDREVSSLLRRRVPRVSVQARQVSVARALQLVLEPLDLCVVLQDLELIIVSERRVPEDATVVTAPPPPAEPPPPPGRVLAPQLPLPTPAPRLRLPDVPRHREPVVPVDAGSGES
jgi:hypothetical protein